MVAALLSACASNPFSAPGIHRFPSAVELEETPFFPQEDYQCGPAALATVLRESGADATPAGLVPRVYVPARRGSLQPEIVAAARDYDRIPYVVAPAFDALLAEVAAGYPVLVLQNLGIAAFPAWHYAVVVGYSADDASVVLRSGRERRRITPAGVFMRTWERSGYWGMIALAPGELPAGDDETRFLQAVAGLEATGRAEAATAAYRASLARWPDSRLARLGLGNTSLAAGRAAEAERWYRDALERAPGDSAVLNNLASAVAAQGRCDDARELLARALSGLPADSPLRGVLADTAREIDACAARAR